MNLIAKLECNLRRYGFISSLGRYIGRQSPRLWRYIGPIATHGYLLRWVESHQHKILNLGGGGNCMDGCLTVDIDARADAYVDLTKPLPFATNSVDAIFCEEVIEHISKDAGSRLLSECYRVLKSGGPIRLTTPDLDYFSLNVLNGDGCDEINNIFYMHAHAYIYTRKALRAACEVAGFGQLKDSFYQDGNSRLGYMDTHADRFGHRPEISQYLEAVKTD
jgi:predicted SAM-dependent methyltransferase